MHIHFFFNFPEIDFFCMLVYKSVDDCRPTRFKLLIFIIFQGNLNSTSFLNRKKEIEYKNMVLKLWAVSWRNHYFYTWNLVFFLITIFKSKKKTCRRLRKMSRHLSEDGLIFTKFKFKIIILILFLHWVDISCIC